MIIAEGQENFHQISFQQIECGIDLLQKMLMVRSPLEVEQDSKERDVETLLRLGKYIDNMEERVCMEKTLEIGYLWRKHWREGIYGENIGDRVCTEKTLENGYVWRKH